ncbi:MAG: hypothetical protein HOC09_13955 [Deltaproteobacteria bacterium]|nr:hypothetical protein [Deltaproteobacteria bacterium]MBT4680819.1 hypothetical protein [Candidatus Paceibacterota bacterium]
MNTKFFKFVRWLFIIGGLFLITSTAAPVKAQSDGDTYIWVSSNISITLIDGTITTVSDAEGKCFAAELVNADENKWGLKNSPGGNILGYVNMITMEFSTPDCKSMKQNGGDATSESSEGSGFEMPSFGSNEKAQWSWFVTQVKSQEWYHVVLFFVVSVVIVIIPPMESRAGVKSTLNKWYLVIMTLVPLMNLAQFFGLSFWFVTDKTLPIIIFMALLAFITIIWLVSNSRPVADPKRKRWDKPVKTKKEGQQFAEKEEATGKWTWDGKYVDIEGSIPFRITLMPITKSDRDKTYSVVFFIWIWFWAELLGGVVVGGQTNIFAWDGFDLILILAVLTGIYELYHELGSFKSLGWAMVKFVGFWMLWALAFAKTLEGDLKVFGFILYPLSTIKGAKDEIDEIGDVFLTCSAILLFIMQVAANKIF